MNLNPPGGVNLAIAIFAFIGATLSVVGFITNHLPHQQYADLCHILQGIESALADDQRWPSDHLLQRYRRYVSPQDDVIPSFQLWRLMQVSLAFQQCLCKCREIPLSSDAVIHFSIQPPDGLETKEYQEVCCKVKGWIDREPFSPLLPKILHSEQDTWRYSIFVGSRSNTKEQEITRIALIHYIDFKGRQLWMSTGIGYRWFFVWLLKIL